jgi:PAS domain S-box-containing protein
MLSSGTPYRVGPLDVPLQLRDALSLPEVLFQDYWAQSPDGLFIVKVAGPGRFVYGDLNPAYFRMTGIKSADVSGLTPEECLPRDAADAVTARCRECVSLGQPIRYVETLERGRGVRHLEKTLVPIRDPVSRRVTVIFGNVRDVTRRRRAHREVETTLRLLQSTLDAIAAPLTLLDEAGTIVAVNHAWRERHDRPPGAAPAWIGRRYLSARAGLKARTGEASIRRDFKALFAGQLNDLATVYRLQDPPAEKWIQLRAARFVHGGAVRFVVSHEDVTGAVVARREAHELAERLLLLQEEERRRIAAELHDSTGQHLVAATLSLCRLRPAAAGNDLATSILDEIATSLEEAQRELRAFTFLLHPPFLEGEGLRDTLRHFVEGFGRRTGLSTRVAIAEEIDAIALPLRRTILRIVQEALVNVHRHACAKSVDVSLTRDANRLVLTVRDDGRGLPRQTRGEAGSVRLGVGIAGMRSRVAELGGSLDIATGRRGTTVTAALPGVAAECA